MDVNLFPFPKSQTVTALPAHNVGLAHEKALFLTLLLFDAVVQGSLTQA
jgi:hypothetical protein